MWREESGGSVALCFYIVVSWRRREEGLWSCKNKEWSRVRLWWENSCSEGKKRQNIYEDVEEEKNEAEEDEADEKAILEDNLTN